MFSNGCVKRVFPGNHTPQGFFSYYDHILPKDATRIFVIKGGPGVGKSTFMTSIAKDMIELGYDVELHHCSSGEKDSVDGVVFPAIGVGIVDGTWPHTVDPRTPGAVDEIIWLGDFWDEESVRAQKTAILEAQKGIESVFRRAYRFLAAAQIVYQDWEAANVEALDFGKANIMAEEIIADNLRSIQVALAPGTERKLFASAITPGGMVNHLDTIVAPCKKRYVIEGDPGTGKSFLLEKVRRAALDRGLFVEGYYCPLHPEKVEHLVIPALSLALTKSIDPHPYVPGLKDTVVDMNLCLDRDIVEKHLPYVARAKEQFQTLFDSVIHYIGLAKGYHDLLEQYYAPNMDFEGIAALRKRTLERILGYAREMEGGYA